MPTPPPPIIISCKALRALPLDTAVSDDALIEVRSVHNQLRTAIDALADTDLHRPALELLWQIAGIHARFEDPASPYGPLAEFENRRSMIPDDLKGAQNEELAAFAPHINNLTLRARVADVVWLNDKRHRECADLAIDAYIARVNEYLDGDAGFRRERDDALHFDIFPILRRAFQISKAIKGKKPYPSTLTVACQRLLKAAFANREIDAIERIVRLALDYSTIDELKVASRLEKALEDGANLDPHSQKALLAQLRRIYRRNDKDSEADTTQLRIAECSVEISEAMATSSMASSSWLMTAIDELRQVKGPKAKKRVQHIRRLLRDKQEDSVFEMGSFSHTSDISELVEATNAQFDGLSLGEALGLFASLNKSDEPEELKTRAQESVRDFPLSAMFGGSHLDHEGKTIARSPGTPFAGSVSDDALLVHMLRDQQIMRNLVVSSAIEPARTHIQAEHSPDLHIFGIIAANSAFVPLHNQAVFELGFVRFFQGDMISAASLLIPQLENSLRHILKASGSDPSTIESDLTQDDRSISSLLSHDRESFERILGSAIVNEIDLLFNVRPGPALRHEVAHGKLSSGQFYSSDVRYACWLIFRLTCLPLFPYWDQISGKIDLD